MRSPSRPLAVSAATALAVGGVLLAASPAHAAEATVDTEAELAAALADAAVDSILIDGDIDLTDELAVIERDLTIEGQGYTIGGTDATYSWNVLDIEGDTDLAVVTLRNLRIDNSEEFGIRAQDADLTLDQVTVDGTEGSVVVDSALNVTGSIFTNADDEGLLVGTVEHATVITDSTFTNNDADGIDIEIGGSASAEITDVQSNSNTSDGLELEVWGSAVLAMRSSTFNLNTDDGIHGDVYDNATVTITDVTTNENKEDGDEGDGIDLVTSSTVPVEIDGVTASKNTEIGLELWVVGTSSIEVTSTTATANGHGGLTAGTEPEIVVAAVPPPVDPAAGTISVTDSTLADNGNVGIEAIIDDPEASLAVLVERSTISGNAFSGARSGAFSGSLQFVLLNSTVSDNGLGVAAGGSEGANSELHVLHSTVVGNGPRPAQSGPIESVGVAFAGTATGTVDHSIVWGTVAGDDLAVSDVAPVIDYTLIGTASTAATAAVGAGIGNQVGVDPELGPLADNGGPTLTHLPSASGPAAGAGDPDIAEAPTTDQRGNGFPRIEGVIELGAVELPAPELAETGGTAPVVPLLAAGLVLLAGLGLLAARRRQDA